MAAPEADAAAASAAAAAAATSIVVYKPEAERFRINLRPSAIGISAGLAAANVTHAVMDRAVQATSSTAAAGLHTVGFVAEKIAEYTLGPTAGMSVMYARHVAADTARNSIRAYSPLTTMLASAAIGTTTAYAVTAGEAILSTAAPLIASAATGAVKFTANAAGQFYNSLPSRDQLFSMFRPRVRITGIHMSAPAPAPAPVDMPPPAFGSAMSSEFPSSPNYVPQTRVIASVSRLEESVEQTGYSTEQPTSAAESASAPGEAPAAGTTAPPPTPALQSAAADADSLPPLKFEEPTI